MKISVIIPVYNSEKFLEKLLKSIFEQTYEDYEIIIVNDGSTDGSLDIINKYSRECLKCITIENSGPGIARKVGFELATGELLFFVDSDDFIPNTNALERINQIYNQYKFDILFFNFIRKNNGKEKNTNMFFNNNMKEGLYSSKYLNKHQVEGALWGKVFVSSKMNIECFCNYNNFEDYYTTYKYLNNCENFYYTKEIFYYANRDNENSISKKKDIKKIYDTVNLLKLTYNNTYYKSIFSKIIYSYYLYARRLLDKVTGTSQVKKQHINKVKELKAYFNLITVFKGRFKIKQFLIYIYYMFCDFIKNIKY